MRDTQWSERSETMMFSRIANVGVRVRQTVIDLEEKNAIPRIRCSVKERRLNLFGHMTYFKTDRSISTEEIFGKSKQKKT